jgi:hypothetical protein
MMGFGYNSILLEKFIFLPLNSNFKALIKIRFRHATYNCSHFRKFAIEHLVQ